MIIKTIHPSVDSDLVLRKGRLRIQQTNSQKVGRQNRSVKHEGGNINNNNNIIIINIDIIKTINIKIIKK